MRIRYYIDMLPGESYEYARERSYATAQSNRLAYDHRRFYVDVDFPPGTFPEETAIPALQARPAEEIK